VKGKRHLLLMVLFLVIAFIYKQAHGGFASTFLFYVVALTVVYEFILFFTLFRGLRVERILDKKRVRAGESQTVVIKIKRTTRFPMSWCVAYESLPSGLSTIPGKIVFPWFRKEAEISYKLSNLSRGVYKLNQITVVSGDLFGLFRASRTLKEYDQLIVHPKLKKLRDWFVKDGQDNGIVELRHRPSADITSIIGIRNYQRGDRLSQIHWKATARAGELRTKEFEQRVSNQLMIFLDTNQEIYGDRDAFEKAVCFTASLVTFAHNNQLKYTLVMAGEQGQLKLLEGGASHDFLRFMDELAGVTTQGKVALHEIVLKRMRYFSRGMHFVLITSNPSNQLSSILADLALKRRKVELVCMSSHIAIEVQAQRKLEKSGVIIHRELA
jgi:uncharacterized protein (DUF58 family)